ncbi:MAG: hypothetical protein R8M71_00705 [Alphaproteobacteria bacterium]|nr:hypothetical protein [Alphaproteobacteria bacterium]
MCAVGKELVRDMVARYEIVNWLNKIGLESNGVLFMSVRFGVPPENKIELCQSCKPIFCRLFRNLLGRHWNKVHKRYFILVGVQEFGKYNNRHAHFLLGIISKFQVAEVMDELKSLSYQLKMDVWTSEEDKLTTSKQFGADIMVKSVYSPRVDEYFSKELGVSDTRLNDNFILDCDMFC